MQPTEGLTDRELLNTLENKLSDLAALWRGRKHQSEADEIVRKYHAILNCMIELGFREGLDVESELPDRLMPQAYLQLHS
ncbi:MAG: hypothetical protein K8L97_08335 [Anaerolineae bacterium]|nr:hypothetical protein [Anaerolineae bacterium]